MGELALSIGDPKKGLKNAGINASKIKSSEGKTIRETSVNSKKFGRKINKKKGKNKKTRNIGSFIIILF